MSNKNWVLIKFERNWADEFDVKGFRVVSKEDWKDWHAKLKVRTGLRFCFGTNEGWEEDDWDANETWENNFKATYITDEQYEVLKALFTDYSGQIKHGIIPNFRDLLDSRDEDYDA
jgi:hypothetical protein